MDNQIIMIPAGSLLHHPKNPRVDLGDLSELAESIKAWGIMQNLTVVKAPTDEGKYWVVIGNRRLEAGLLAGLEFFPCSVSDMDEKEQMATMLMENMQRQDLTVYEQAQGFQMMMDLGFTQKEISEKTGFSETTVKNRLKLTKFRKDDFSKACDRGATLFDFMEISKLNSKTAQHEVLQAAGTENFQAKMQQALREQEFSKNKARLEPIVKAAMKEMPDGEHYNSKWERVFEFQMDGETDALKKRIEKLKPDDGPYCYRIVSWGKCGDITIYKQHKKGVALSEWEKNQRAISRKRNAQVRKVKTFYQQAYELRCKFVSEFALNGKAGGIITILENILGAALSQQNSWNHKLPSGPDWDETYIRSVLSLPESSAEGKTLWDDIEDKDPPIHRILLSFALGGGVLHDTPELGWYDRSDGKHEPNRWNADEVNAIYGLLEKMGYEMSDFEKSLKDGSHECYREDA